MVATEVSIADEFAPAEQTTAARPAFAETPTLGPGDRIDRYVMITKLGFGGMGVVYAAHDPELDRRVAIKLLRRPRAADDPDSLRLLREAQALAKLAHPNVVAVHDAGHHEGRVWLAMEFIPGKTLRAWLNERARSWREVVAVIVEVARGVAAAHAAGILHRDLKPDNVMIDAEQRVRVLDFGLARAEFGAHASEAGSSSLSVELTDPSSLLGTPAYMAPEQRLGVRVDARTDLFSLCVTLWEALYGERPFDERSDTIDALAPVARRPRPRGRRVPAWLRRVCERGLAADPDERWQSVAELLAALERGQRRASLRVAGVVVLGAGVVGLGIMGWQRVDEERKAASCEQQSAAIDEVWNPAARARLEAALLDTGVANAPTVVAKLLPRLDDQAIALRAATRHVCREHELHERWDDTLYARARACLAERSDGLEVVIAELGSGRPAMVQAAIPAAAKLASVEDCSDPSELERQPTAPRERLEQIAGVRASLIRAAVLVDAGELELAEREASDAGEQAILVAWPPLLAEARELEARVQVAQARYPEAERSLIEAYFGAREAGDDATSTRAASALITIVGVQQARPEEGLLWSRQAELGLHELGSDDDLFTADWLERRALLEHERAAYPQAIAMHERALAIRERSLGSEHPSVTASLSNLANTHVKAGQLDTALALHERALASAERVLGPDHPGVADQLDGIASVELARGHAEVARVSYERALTIREAALGPDHPSVAVLLNNLASVDAATGDSVSALARLERVEQIWRRVHGEQHPRVALALRNLAVLHRKLGDHEEADALLNRARTIQEAALGPEHPDLTATLGSLALGRLQAGELEQAQALFERVLAIQEKVFGAAHIDVGMTLNNLAMVEKKRGRLDAAEAHYRRAIAIVEQVRGPDHVSLAAPLINLAELARARARPSDAIEPAERAITLLERGQGALRDLGTARFVLAKALWESGERARARELAKQAREAATEADKSGAALLADVDAWLAERDEG